MAFICLACHEGSLRERSPLPKKPRLHKIVESLVLVTHTERVAGSKTPSQCGLYTRALEYPNRPKT